MFLYFLLILLCFCSSYFLLSALPERRRRWKKYRMIDYVRGEKLTPLLLRLLLLTPNRQYVEHYRQLLIGCGIKFETSHYLIMKRGAMITGIVIGALAYSIWESRLAINFVLIVTMALLSVSLWSLSVLDKYVLQLFRRKRSERIVQEVYVISKQLLYYSGSKMNLYSKLRHCIPFTTTLRHDMELLIREWVEGAESAINKFKFRLGTDEGFSFAETINSLRLHESERYYDLLRQRIQDYKEKIQLHKESKKEASSYVLFILAGLPIMNTFRVFIYPWVQEGQKLFESLN